MPLRILVVVLLVVSLSAASCVRVTTARRAGVEGESPAGDRVKSSEVEVKTYGWEPLEVLVHIVVFPFKVVWKAIDLIV